LGPDTQADHARGTRDEGRDPERVAGVARIDDVLFVQQVIDEGDRVVGLARRAGTAGAITLAIAAGGDASFSKR
jgi:hypothetical protein